MVPERIEVTALLCLEGDSRNKAKAISVVCSNLFGPYRQSVYPRATKSTEPVSCRQCGMTYSG